MRDRDVTGLQTCALPISFCGTIQCEVLSSSVTNETAVLSPSGNITARVAPQDLNKFLDFVGKQGKIAQHATESEDKTDRKSTRLNSSHITISYAVFCLKK